VVPAKRPGDNLLIGTWKVRGSDRPAPKWRSMAGDSPSATSATCCASLRWCGFDIIAVQEVCRSAQAFLAVLQVLGAGWAFLVTDVTGWSCPGSVDTASAISKP
jgi:hypothetical protein